MKIVLVSAVPPPEGGIATWTTKYLAYCKNKGLKINLVNTALQGKRGNQINTKRNIWDEIKRTFFVIGKMKRAICDSDVDLVHINTSCSSFGIIRDFLCASMAKKKNLPIVLQCHCNINDQIQKRYGKQMLKKICEKSSKILVLNSDSYNYIKSLGFQKPIIVPNFIEIDMLSESHIINEDINEIIFVGHVQRTKGCIEIIEAARMLKDIHFTLIGPVDSEVKAVDIPSNVLLTGAKPFSEIRNFLSCADLYLFPSYTEGFSLSLTEAMANGLPCIATNVGANKDMLEDKGGIIVPVNDVGAIVSAINELREPNVRFKKSEWNINKVKKEYLLDIVMDKIVTIYKMV